MTASYPQDRWIGIDETAFAPYKNWITHSGYLCGTNAASVLLAYYQDYIDPEIVPKTLRSPDSRDGETLAAFLRILIQPHELPTLAFQVAHGLSKFFTYFHLSYRARATMAGGWYRGVKRIQQGKPVILGLMKAKGSTYGNHWVTAYGFMETADGKRYFKVHDNWGNYRKVIPAEWVNGTVSLP